MAEDEMVGWYHQLSGQQFEQTLRNSEGQGSLACHSTWGHKELEMTEQLNNNKKLLLEKTEESEIKLPTSTGSQKK